MNYKETKSSFTVASSIFASTEDTITSSSENNKPNESSSASIDTPNSNHAKEA
ncbi:hypothetical protein [Streptococcus thermophilus]|uniref:hypothetical protein n=1 Tax=Streptococcus thermophilus TaxID=1308 RepID=UPI0015C2A94F|nr:hypothetical protein [Streptococcus thermophilus]CAD0172271.1 conserved protein of unknown function [Streptococcus thermophilus]